MVNSVDLAVSQGVNFNKEQKCSLISKILKVVMTIFFAPFSCLSSQRKPSLDLKMRDLVHQQSKERALLETVLCDEYEESLMSMEQAEREVRSSIEQLARERARAIEMFTAPTRAERVKDHVEKLLDKEVAHQLLLKFTEPRV